MGRAVRRIRPRLQGGGQGKRAAAKANRTGARPPTPPESRNRRNPRAADKTMITITPRAAEKIRESIAQSQAESESESESDTPGLSLRLAARRLADGSFDYAMGLDAPGQHDSRADSNGVAVIAAPTSAEFLRGATLDYVEFAPGEYRFIFLNPNDPAFVPPEA